MTESRLPDVFKEFWDRCSSDVSDLNAHVDYKPGRRVKLFIPKISDTGFNIRETCETYGIYPEAGDWHGASWDNYEEWAEPEVICRDFFGFLRMLLSEDSRLKYIYRRKSVRLIKVELLSNNGWVAFEETGFLYYPLERLLRRYFKTAICHQGTRMKDYSFQKLYLVYIRGDKGIL